MDLLSVGASVVGLLAVTVKATNLLKQFVDNYRDAESLANNVQNEVSDVAACLVQLQEFLIGASTVSGSRSSLLMIEQVVVVLTNCVLIFSELEKTLDNIFNVSMPMTSQLKWAKKAKALSNILPRLQSSKASLSLILTTISWYVLSERHT